MKDSTAEKIILPEISFDGITLGFEPVPLTISNEIAADKCTHCDEEFTYDQVKYVVPLAEEVITKKILVYLNKYRENYQLDTCLRKAHFIAQIGAEMQFMSSKLKEGSSYHHTALKSLFGKHFKDDVVIDTVVLDSLESHLTEIFKIVDKEDKTIVKTNAQLKKIIKENSVKANIRELYGRRDREEPKYTVPDKEKALKTVYETKKVKGVEVTSIKFKVILLKRSKSFGIETLSRVYANRNKNGDELSREGFMYRGRGMKQITFKNNYSRFSSYRKNNPFPDDSEGYIDFSKITDSTKLDGNFDKLADKNNVVYAVQSAVWFYLKGNPRNKKYTVDYADEDSIQYCSYTLNGGWNGLQNRLDNTLRAREDEGFKVYAHYNELYEKGSEAVKKNIEDKLKEIGKKLIIRKINLKDPKANNLLKKIRRKKVEVMQPLPFKLIPMEITLPDLQLVPIGIEN